jgi:hypothetical protein
MSKNPLNIYVTGNPGDEKDTVVSLINHALEDSGFTNVQILAEHNQPKDPIESDTLVSMLDLMKKSKPAIFNNPISIHDVPTLSVAQFNVTMEVSESLPEVDIDLAEEEISEGLHIERD